MRHSASTDVLLVEDLGQQRLPARTLAAILRQAGLSARLVHFGVGDGPGGVVALARCEQPRLIVLSILFAHLVAENLALAAHLRAASVTAHLTAVGPLPTFAYADLLAACPALDSVLRGEAEAGVVQLAARLDNAADWQAVPGLAYRSPALRANPLPQPVPGLDDLPFPVRDGGIPARLGFGFATVESSRGCYHACTFCLPCAFYRAGTAPPYRLRSIPNLVEEIDALYQQGTRLFLFDDEQFLPPGRAREERVKALADQLRRHGLDIAFTIKCRADDVEEALFRQLKAMGLVRVYLGVESGCQASLDLLGKGVTVAGNAQALALLDALDIVADFRSLLFHPWSTLETIQADIGFLEQVLPNVPTPFTFHEVECYPGTSLAEQLRAEGPVLRPAPPAPSAEEGSEAEGWDRGDPWPLAYTIAAPGAELLRRLGRVVFGSRNADQGIHSQIVQAWYDMLLLRRFRPERLAAGKARALRDIVVRFNHESLGIWREMLSFASGGDIHNADRVNERASAWAGRVNAFDMMLEEELSELRKGTEIGNALPGTGIGVRHGQGLG
jgi:anaerobic magnesium-protoporphyrin IX monomethyl ester cyclase